MLLFNKLYNREIEACCGFCGAVCTAASAAKQEAGVSPNQPHAPAAAARHMGRSTLPITFITSAHLGSEAKFPIRFSRSWSSKWCRGAGRSPRLAQCTAKDPGCKLIRTKWPSCCRGWQERFGHNTTPLLVCKESNQG